MSLKYKINVLDELKKHGFTTYKLQKENLLSNGTIDKIRHNKSIGWDNIEIICKLLKAQPNDFLIYIDEESDAQDTNS